VKTLIAFHNSNTIFHSSTQTFILLPRLKTSSSLGFLRNWQWAFSNRNPNYEDVRNQNLNTLRVLKFLFFLYFENMFPIFLMFQNCNINLTSSKIYTEIHLVSICETKVPNMVFKNENLNLKSWLWLWKLSEKPNWELGKCQISGILYIKIQTLMNIN